jgi:hypothetical protein
VWLGVPRAASRSRRDAARGFFIFPKEPAIMPRGMRYAATVGVGLLLVGLVVADDKPKEGPASGDVTLKLPSGFSGRSAAMRQELLKKYGGTAESEAAVAAGLLFLAQHQGADGSWSLDEFHLNYHEKPDPAAPAKDSNCTGQGNLKNDIAGTAFGLLPFLGAGMAHKPLLGEKKLAHNYAKTVDAALQYLLLKQGAGGDFGGGMYAHALATMAVCEAYGLTADPQLKKPAQKAIDHIVAAQDPAGGGWRYVPRQGGDTSVTGWQVAALKAGQMAGLNVPAATLKGAEKWLDSVMLPDKGGYGYTGPQETPTMSAVGLLSRLNLGWGPENSGVVAGVPRLKRNPPEGNNVYYNYYASQVMFRVGGDNWEFWNPRMRDLLLKTQDQGKDPARPAQKGSWDPKPDHHGAVAGRIMITSLSLVTLEVYYRHRP